MGREVKCKIRWEVGTKENEVCNIMNHLRWHELDGEWMLKKEMPGSEGQRTQVWIKSD